MISMRILCGTFSLAIVGSFVALSTDANAQPTNTAAAAGGAWANVGTGNYTTGQLTTETGGTPGQSAPPYFDTSFGVMDETGTAWFTGNDLSAQQFVQSQVFGDLGAASPSPAPWGLAGPPASGDPNARFYNYGYGGTTAGSNFPTTAAEQRSITVNHWNNTNPDAGGTAAVGQQVFVPTSAKISIDFGFGGDEMFFDMIGGNSGQQSKFTASVEQLASYTINGIGAYTGGASGGLTYTASMQNNDAGPGGAYQAAQWGLGGGGGAVGFDTFGTRTWNGTTLNSATQGIPPNSIGTAISEITGMVDMISIGAGSVEENGGSFAVDFDSSAELTNFIRDFGNADGRVSFGPGMLGAITYEVNYDVWEVTAIPEPGPSMFLLSASLVVLGRRRRRSV